MHRYNVDWHVSTCIILMFKLCVTIYKFIKIIVFFLILATPSPEPVLSPCDPTPCGDNAECSELGRAAACKCLPGFFGDPYLSCRPECVLNTDCSTSLACINAKCRDPCPGTCGINAICNVFNHVPKCACLQGYIGDAVNECHLPPCKFWSSDSLEVRFSVRFSVCLVCVSGVCVCVSEFLCVPKFPIRQFVYFLPII